MDTTSIAFVHDNRSGGWYAYRGSKAAQNMFTKTIAIELQRVRPHAVVLGLHPGTVDTGLSKPFQRNVPESKLFQRSTRSTVSYGVIDRAGPKDTGHVFDFRGEEVPP